MSAEVEAPDEFAFVLCSDGMWRPAFLHCDIDGMPHEWIFALGGRRRWDNSQSMTLSEVLAARDAALRESLAVEVEAARDGGFLGMFNDGYGVGIAKAARIIRGAAQ